MFKRISQKTARKIIIFLILTVVFFAGVLFGKFGRSTACAELPEPTITPTREVLFVCDIEERTETHEERTETPMPEYTELTVTATAYCPCEKCCGKCDGITATGTKATAGRTIAVDPSIIPYGTEVVIAGNTYIAEDCGGAIKGNAVDIFFDTHEEALTFGKQQVVATIKN